MRRILELFFRHATKILALLVIPVVIAVSIVWAQPRKYEATATLWALQRYAVIGASGPEADTFATPASTQSTALTELLQTRSFDLAVARETDLASTFNAATRANTEQLNDAIVQELSTKVQPTAVGFNLYQITYNSLNPQIALQVIKAVVDQFGAAAGSFSVAEAKQLIQTYQAELDQARKSANTATQAATQYSLSHPSATAQNDSVYNQLLQQVQGAQANVGNLQGQITQLNQQLATVGNGSENLYTVVDAPNVNSRPVSRTKTLALGGGIGLAVGLLAIVILLVMLGRRDRSVYSPDDLRRAINLPVALELPKLTPAMVAATTQTPPALPERGGSSR